MLHSRCILFVIAMVLGVASASARAEPPRSQRAKIVEIMEITGGKTMLDEFMQVFIQQLSTDVRRTNPNIPERAHEVIRDVIIAVLKEHSQELLSSMIPLYEKHFTETELDELLAFYRTPTGQKAIKELPALVQESIPISQSWLRNLEPVLQPRLRERLAAEGFLR
jgi:hypothetical protein